MPKLSLHLRIELALATLLLLGSCEKQRATEPVTVDFVDVNARNALARVQSLETRISKLEKQAAATDRYIETATANAAAERRTANAFREGTQERLQRIERRLADTARRR
jgi:hypothetical protein